MIFDAPITIPIHMPVRPVFDDVARAALRASLSPVDQGTPGDIVGVILNVSVFCVSRRRFMRFCIESDQDYVRRDAEGKFGRATWRHLSEDDATRMARLTMTLASGRNPLSAAGAEPVVDAMLDEEESLLSLEVLVTPNALILAQDDWMEVFFGFDDADPDVVEMCFALIPCDRPASAHDRRQKARKLADDGALVDWFLGCAGAEPAFAPGITIPSLPD